MAIDPDTLDHVLTLGQALEDLARATLTCAQT
jgi:hypothetical protein